MAVIPFLDSVVVVTLDSRGWPPRLQRYVLSLCLSPQLFVLTQKEKLDTEPKRATVQEDDSTGQLANDVFEKELNERHGGNSVLSEGPGVELQLADTDVRDNGHLDQVVLPTQIDQKDGDGKQQAQGTKRGSSASTWLRAAIVCFLVFLVYKCASIPNFRDIYNRYCDSYYAEVASDGSYLSIDTNPLDLNGHSDDDAMYAIERVNDALNIPDSVLTRMRSTRALDGTQTYSNDTIEVYWTFHPDDGLEVVYSIK